ncbi:MAG: DUF4173 domain-containing protein [Actinomycetia bacterium]|nr:DUF4173 domain-containing protein [Actinomycetes bacterium]
MTRSSTWRAPDPADRRADPDPPPLPEASPAHGPPRPEAPDLARHAFGPLPLDWSKPLAPLPAPSGAVLAVIVVVAFVANLAARLPAASLIGSVTVVTGLGLVVAGRRPVPRPDLVATCLLAALGMTLSIRTSPWVTSMTVVAVVALLLLLAADGLTVTRPRPWIRTLTKATDKLHDSLIWLPPLVASVTRSDRRRAAAALRTAAVAGAVVLVLASLLASGDAVFANLVVALDPIAGGGHIVLTAVFVVPVAALVLLASAERDDDETTTAGSPRFQAESRAVVWSVAAILGVWCIIQIVVLSGGAEAVLAAEGLTPAEYARQGFFQLVAVAAVSLAVLNGAHRSSRSADGPDPHQRVPAGLMGLALGGLIVVTFSRLWFYMETFGLTMLRLSVATFLCWLAIMTALSVIRALGLRSDLNWLPTFAVLSAAVLALVFALVNPEALVARTNLDRATHSAEVDIVYLTTLSEDAKGAVADFDWISLDGRPSSITEWLCDEPTSYGYGPLSWNWARRSRSLCDVPL